jgi:hypothetical protein
MTRAEFDDVCATLEIEFPISQTSGRRTALRNTKVGGNPNSFHLSGRGRDYVWDSGSRAPRLARFKRRVKGLGLKLVAEGDHDHLQPLVG